MGVDRDRAAEDAWSAHPEPDLDEIVDSLGSGAEEPRLQPGERRQVALLFVELQDLFSWEEVLKADELRRVLDKVYAVFSGIVASFGGYVDRTEGAMVLSVFGNRAASELDAERAARAALDMFDKLHNINRYLSHRGIHLDIKAGVHSGSVSVDAQGRLQSGQAIQVALDLNRSAAVNTVLISRAARDLAGDVFLFESLGHIHLGGHPEATETFRVVGLNPRGEGRWLRSTLVRRARFIGRGRTRDALFKAWDDASEPDSWPWERDPYSASRRWVAPIFVGIRGDAGAGKSRLLMELGARLEQEAGGRVVILQGRADPLAHVPYGLFVNLLKRFAGIQDEDAQAVRRRKLEAATRPLFVADPVLKAYLPVMGWLLGVTYDDAPIPEGDPVAVQEEIHIALTAFLRSVAILGFRELSRPVVIFLKDLHAADERSISSLLTVLERLRLQLPIMVVATWRTGFRPPRELGLICRYQELTLGPLSHQEVSALVSSMLDGFRLPGAVVRRLQRLASGNPFYVEELVRNMVDEQVLVKTSDGWRLAQPDAEISLPQSLSGLILARVDTLPREVRDTLVCASAVGVVVSRAVLADVVRRLGRPSPEPHLRVLLEGRFLRTIPAAREESFTFPNLLSREVVYGTLLPANRRTLHRVIGEAILQIYEGNLSEHYGSLGMHFAEGGEKTRAARYLALAAEKAMAENSSDLALTYLHRYVGLGRQGPDVQRARWRLAQVLRRLGRLSESSETLEALIAEEKENPVGPEATSLAFSLRLELCAIRRAQGRREDALAWCDEALSRADATGDVQGGIEARFTRVQCLRQLGRWEEAAQALDELAPRLDAQDADTWDGELPSQRGRLALAQDQLEDAVRYFEETLRIRMTGLDRGALAADLCNLSEALLALGRLTEARLRLSEALAQVEGMGNAPLAAATRMLRGALEALSGDAEGLWRINETLDACEARGNRPATLLGYRLRTRVLTHLGRLEEAEASSAAARERFGPGAMP